MRLVIVPRWGGNADSDFYPWLREQVAGVFDSVVSVPLRPSPDAPQIEPSVEALRAELLRDTSRTFVMSHSAGNQAVMHTLATLEAGAVAGCLLVAGWLSLDEPWDSIRPWVDTPIDGARVRAATTALKVMVSTNDRFTADYEATTAAFESLLGTTARVVEGRNHFNDPEQPEVHEELMALCTPSEA